MRVDNTTYRLSARSAIHFDQLVDAVLFGLKRQANSRFIILVICMKIRNRYLIK